MKYSIIIPIFNEVNTLKSLLNGLKDYSKEGHQILLIDDGSKDKSELILKKCNFIKVIYLKKNYGKGIAIRVGLFYSRYDKVIIFDGDLELKTSGIRKLMGLDRSNNINSILGTRFIKCGHMLSLNNFGNFLFTSFFNLLKQTNHKDVLCCAKSFFKSDIKLNKIKSLSFDIDIEITSFLSKNNKGKNIKTIYFEYNRRTISQGKKLRTNDGWLIIKRILLNL